MIDQHTVMCISVAARPSSFGSTLHNAAYRALGLNYVYKAFGVEDLPGALVGVRALGIRGCSVSMPFKEAVIPLLDDVEGTARAIGAVNTVVNERSRLTGYNTDWIGARAWLESVGAKPHETALVLGAGGAVRAILCALEDLGLSSVRIACRRPERAASLRRLMDCEYVPWAHRNEASADLIINATPLGMSERDPMPIEGDRVEASRAILDVVVSPRETPLVSTARRAKREVAPGHVMMLHQAAAQFELYTGVKAPMDVLRESLTQLLHG